MRYLNECEFDMFGDLNNVEPNFYDYDYDLYDGPHCQIILLVVKIIFGKLLKCVFVNEINENEEENEIWLELEFKNVNVNIDCNGCKYLPPYPTCTIAQHCLNSLIQQ